MTKLQEATAKVLADPNVEFLEAISEVLKAATEDLQDMRNAWKERVDLAQSFLQERERDRQDQQQPTGKTPYIC